MTRLMRTTVLLALLAGAVSLPSLAQTTPQPDITTQREADRTVEEYRVNGRLYAIRVIPRSGKAYYLYDASGDGNFERRESAQVPVPDWVRKE
ncbi:DUF2782 domain-containing protein [Salinicola peritrichatus]|uniref:DUF2782 domain-containing protein n=1 Tax=Salinicola peritrichatus TaxID=1267424 RepID=UPI00195519B8|nr:DUF2782 domain-containing protein [Salinicola peritrichatus]